jgi:hypothetical protein
VHDPGRLMILLRTGSAFLSVLFLPWPCTVLLALWAGLAEPWVPLAVGFFTDALYYTPSVGLPYGSLLGILTTAALFGMRSRMHSGIIG